MARPYDPNRAPNPADLQGAVGNPAQMAQVYGLQVNGMSPQEVAELARQRHEDHTRRTRNYNVVPDDVGGFKYTPNENMLKAQEERKRRSYLEGQSGRDGISYEDLAKQYDNTPGTHAEKAGKLYDRTIHQARTEGKQAREQQARNIAWENYRAQQQAMAEAQQRQQQSGELGQAAQYMMQMEHMYPGQGYAKLAASLLTSQAANATTRYGHDTQYQVAKMNDGTGRYIAQMEDGTKRVISAEQFRQMGLDRDQRGQFHGDELGFKRDQMAQQNDQFGQTLGQQDRHHRDEMGLGHDRLTQEGLQHRDRMSESQADREQRGQFQQDEMGLQRERMDTETERYRHEQGMTAQEVHYDENDNPRPMDNRGIGLIEDYARRQAGGDEGAYYNIVKTEIAESPHYQDMIDLANDRSQEGVDAIPDSWFGSLARAEAGESRLASPDAKDFDRYRAFLSSNGLADSNFLRAKYGRVMGLPNDWQYSGWSWSPEPLIPYGQ